MCSTFLHADDAKLYKHVSQDKDYADLQTVVDSIYKSSAVAEMGDRGHNRHGPKRGGGGCCAPFAGAVTPSSTMWPGPRSTSVPSGSSSIQPFGHNRDGPKIGWGGCAHFSRGCWVHIEHNVA